MVNLYRSLGNLSSYMVFHLDHRLMILLANSKSGERYHKKGHFSLLGGEYQPPLALEKNRTPLRKSNSPTISLSGGGLTLMGLSLWPVKALPPVATTSSLYWCLDYEDLSEP